MIKALKNMIPYLLVCAIFFYIIALPMKNGLFAFTLLIINPAVCFITSVFYVMKNKFNPFQLLYPLFAGILFIPAVFIFYNSSALIYAVYYAAVALLGILIGFIILKAVRRAEKTF